MIIEMIQKKIFISESDFSSLYFPTKNDLNVFLFIIRNGFIIEFSIETKCTSDNSKLSCTRFTSRFLVFFSSNH